MSYLLRATYKMGKDAEGHDRQCEIAVEGFGPETVLGAVRDLIQPEHRNSDDDQIEKIEIISNWDGKEIWGYR